MRKTELHEREADGEQPAYAQVLKINGIEVSARCYRIAMPRLRYEIVLRAEGESAVVDVAIEQGPDLPAYVELAADGFVTALRIRRGMYAT